MALDIDVIKVEDGVVDIVVTHNGYSAPMRVKDVSGTTRQEMLNSLADKVRAAVSVAVDRAQTRASIRRKARAGVDRLTQLKDRLGRI